MRRAFLLTQRLVKLSVGIGVALGLVGVISTAQAATLSPGDILVADPSAPTDRWASNRRVKTLLGLAAAGLAALLGVVNSGQGAKLFISDAQAQTCVASPSGLVSWWPGDGDAGDIVGLNQGLLQNGATFTPGKVGQAFRFDGVDDFVLLPQDFLSTPNGITIDMWINPAETRSLRFLFSLEGAYGIYFNRFSSAGGILPFFDGSTGDANEPGSDFGSNLNDGQWHHIAATNAGGVTKVYVDGAFAGSKSETLFDINAVHAAGAIGSQVGGVQHVSGLIDEVEIFNRALTAAEIQAIFAAGSAGKCKAVCGDVVVGVGERCDDGNTLGGDGCSADCRSNETCGNGVVDAAVGEQCDDGNALGSDGCSAVCKIEPGAVCTGAPSVCLVCAAPPADLVSFWDADAVSGLLAFDIQDGNDGVLVGGTEIVPGKVGKAFGFDGFDDTVQFDFTSPPAGGGTIDMWVKTTEERSLRFFLLVGPWGVFLNRFSSVGGILPFFDGTTSSGTPEPGQDFGSGVNDGNWHHIAATNDGTTTRAYIDGVLVGSKVEPFVLPVGVRGAIGGEVASVRMVNSLIDEVEIFNRALTAAEIQAIFAAGSAGKCKALTIATKALPADALGKFSSHQLEARSGSPPYSWSLVSGTVPSGMSLGADGILSGTPTEADTFTFTVRVTDSAGKTAERTFTKEVLVTLPPPALRITKWGSTAVPGRILDYYIVVENIGDVAAGAFGVMEFVEPEIFELISTNPPALSIDDYTDFQQILWDVPTLAPGAFTILTYSARLRPETPLGTEVVGGEVCITPASKTKCGCEEFSLLFLKGACHPSEQLETLRACIEQKMHEANIDPGFTTTFEGEHGCKPSWHFGAGCAKDGIGALAVDYGLGTGTGEVAHGDTVRKFAQQCGSGEARCEQGSTGVECTSGLADHVHINVNAPQCRTGPSGFKPCRSHSQKASGPLDPNEKGVTAPPFIQPDQTLLYPIHFENVSPDVEAKDVFLTDTLDTDLDLSTAEVFSPTGGFTALPVDQTVILKEQQHTRTIDVGGVPVKQTYTETWSVSLDSVTRTLQWKLLNINLAPGETDNVLVSLKPLPGLPAGTEIRNTATIRFEIFDPLTTNEVRNVIDDVPPTCTVDPLPANSPRTVIPLSWTAADRVGQVDTHTLFVSEDGGPFRQHTTTSDATTTFTGQPGKTYSFLCIARDTAGNTEVQSPAAEATTVTPTNRPPTASAGADQAAECGSPAGVTVSLDGSASTDPDGDRLTYAWSALGITFDDPTNATPKATFPIGTTTITLTVNDGIVNSTPDKVDITVKDTTAPEITAAWEPVDVEDNEEGFTIKFSATDVCDPAPRVMGVVETPSLAGLETKLMKEDFMKLDFDLDEKQLEIMGPDPQNLLEQLKVHAGFLVDSGLRALVEIGDEETEHEFAVGEDAKLSIEAPRAALQVTATDASGNSKTVTVSPAFATGDDDAEEDEAEEDDDEDNED